MSWIRNTVGKASRNKILQRNLPEEFGRAPLFVSPDSALSLWKTRLESDLFNYAREFVKPGDVVWDIGANVGLFVAAAAQKSGPGGEIIAIEPDIWLASLLRRTVASQGPAAAKIQILPAAVSDTPAIVTLLIANQGRACNRLSTAPENPHAGGVRESVQVLSITLDWLLDQGKPPNVVKIDVEGAEGSVLRGANRLLSEVRPVILCEVHDRDRAEISDTFHRHGYALYDWDQPSRIEVQEATFNTLAIPTPR
jgi:FkbM family methyltransferase